MKTRSPFWFWWSLCGAVLCAGLMVSNAVDGDSYRFMTNATLGVILSLWARDDWRDARKPG